MPRPIAIAVPAVLAAVLLAIVLAGRDGPRTPSPAPGPRLPAAREAALLARLRPIYRQDARDPDRPTGVESLISHAVLRGPDGAVLDRHPNARSLRAGGRGASLDGPDDGAPSGAPVVYGAVRRQDGRTWLQYWTFLPDNPQDRGILRTGRHEGDWEFSQIGLDPHGRPAAVTVAQHKWAEACPWTRVRRDAGRPVLWLANGSHATYLRPGTHDRPWPDPDDEARGDGARVDPALLLLDEQPWRGWAGRWGGSRAGALLPVEASSPVGPAFQADGRLRTPTTFHDDARPCGSGAPTTARDVAAGTGGLLLAVVVVVVRRARGRGRRELRPARSCG